MFQAYWREPTNLCSKMPLFIGSVRTTLSGPRSAFDLTRVYFRNFSTASHFGWLTTPSKALPVPSSRVSSSRLSSTPSINKLPLGLSRIARPSKPEDDNPNHTAGPFGMNGRAILILLSVWLFLTFASISRKLSLRECLTHLPRSMSPTCCSLFVSSFVVFLSSPMRFPTSGSSCTT